MLVGLSVEPSIAPRLREWLDEWQLPFAVTPKVKGIVDETAPNFVGVISGMAADGVMVEALKAADLLIGFGLDPVEDRQDLACRAADRSGCSKRRMPPGACPTACRSSITRRCSTRWSPPRRRGRGPAVRASFRRSAATC